VLPQLRCKRKGGTSAGSVQAQVLDTAQAQGMARVGCCCPVGNGKGKKGMERIVLRGGMETILLFIVMYFCCHFFPVMKKVTKKITAAPQRLPKLRRS